MTSYNVSLTSMGHLKSVEFVRVKKNMYKTSKVMRSIEYTFLPCMFCFLNSDHMMFSRQFAFCLFINYAYVVTWMHVHKTKFEKKLFSGVPSRGLKWENKTYKLKTSIRLE